MNTTNRFGGTAAILSGVCLLVAAFLGFGAFASAPAMDFSQAATSEGGLALFAVMPSNGRLLFRGLLTFQVLSVALAVPALLALFQHLKAASWLNAASGLGLVLISLPFNVADALIGLPPTGGWMDAYQRAGEAQRSAFLAVHSYVQDLHLLATFNIFFGLAMLLYSRALFRANVPRWLAWTGLLLGVFSLAVLLNQFVSLLFTLLFVIWFIGLGLWLRKTSSA